MFAARAAAATNRLQHSCPGRSSPSLNAEPCCNPVLLTTCCSQVRTPGGQQSPFYDDLAKAQADAESHSLGLWTKDKDALAAAVRDVQSADGAALLCQIPGALAGDVDVSQ